MARAGIYKSEVLRARAKLLAQGINPSIDAVRVELGNTGSKTTISRYLKEIEEEEGARTGANISVSETLQDLVARLAERLHEEAETRIAESDKRHAAEIEQFRATQKTLQSEVNSLRNSLEQSEASLVAEQAHHRQTSERLREENLTRTRLAQQVADQQERLDAEERHRKSLEEKHQHARQALDHFRAAAKDQREQDQRQHDQQVQYLQGEVRTLNQTLTQKQQAMAQSNLENARLIGELARAETKLQDLRVELRGLKGMQEQLASAQQQVENLGRQVVELEVSLNELAGDKAMLEAKAAENAVQIQQLTVDLASAEASAAVQDQIAEKIKVWIAQASESKKSTSQALHAGNST